MKQYLSFWTLLISGMLVFASCDNDDDGPNGGNGNVPQEVLAAFEKEYGNEPATWEIKGDYAVASLTRSGEAAWFDLKTAFIGMKETDIRFDQLPLAVQTAFNESAYKDWRIDDVDKLTRTNSETLYVIEAEQGEQDVDLYYTEDGVLVQEFLDAESGDYHEYFPQTPSTDVETWVKENLGANARIVDFDREDGCIEVEVIVDGLKHEVLFSTAGEWLQTKIEYENRTLNLVPQVVLDAAKAEHPGAWVEDVEKIVTADMTYYCVELEGQNDRDYKVFVDAATNQVVQRPTLPEDGIQGGVSVGADYETFINEKYAGAVILERDDDDGMVEIEIIHDKVKKEVKFRAGEWIRTEWEAPLPDDIKALVQEAGYEPEVREVDVIETSKGIAYELEAWKGNVEYDVYVDEEGNVTSRRD